MSEVYAAVREGGGLLDLSGRARFHLSGNDRVRFLNGQISNAVVDLPRGECRPACVMTAKGKMSAFIFYSASADFIRLDALEAQREELAARLERYIIADDVVLEDAAEKEALLHVVGASPEVPDGVEVAAANRFGLPGTDVYVSPERAEALWQALAARYTMPSSEVIESLRIEHGIPEWGAELDESTIPVEAGLDRNAIDYEKGCYIGQEVISRLKSIGRVNRQLRGLVAAPGAALEAGMELFDPAGGERPVGSVTSAAHSFALARPAGLGYVKRGVETGVLHAVGAGDRSGAIEVEVRPLPLIP